MNDDTKAALGKLTQQLESDANHLAHVHLYNKRLRENNISLMEKNEKLNAENETLLAQVESLTKQLNAQTEPMTIWHTRKIRDLAARVDALQKANDNQITMHDANRKATNEKKLSCGCVITASIVPAPCSAPFTEGDQIRLVLNVKECTGLCGEFLFKNITIKATPFVPKGTFFVINGLP